MLPHSRAQWGQGRTSLVYLYEIASLRYTIVDLVHSMYIPLPCRIPCRRGLWIMQCISRMIVMC